MLIVSGYPPNIEAIRKAFSLEGKSPVFAYGHFLYNPNKLPIADHLMAHEETHERQQVKFGSVELWWEKYIADAQFRLEQEQEAYMEQYRFVKRKIKDRNAVARFLHAIAVELSGMMYGNIISYDDAKQAISR